MSDPTIQELLKEILRFRDARDWKQFHTPRHLAAALSIEASELQELFLWKTDNEVAASSQVRSQISQEVADVMIYALLLAHEFRISPLRAIKDKLAVNARNYPISLSRGSTAKQPGRADKTQHFDDPMKHSDVVLLPRGATKDNENYENTIVNTVRFEKIAAHLGDDDPALDILRSQSKTGIATWGFRPGVGRTKWKALRPGHTLGAFTGDKTLFSYGRIIATARSASLARNLWGLYENGDTWEFLIFFDQVKKLGKPIPYITLSETLGFASNFNYPSAISVHHPASIKLIDLIKQAG